MNTRFYRFISYFLFLIDLLTINFVFFLTFKISNSYLSFFTDLNYLILFLVVNCTWILSVLLLNVYNELNLFLFDAFGRTSIKSIGLFFLLITAYFLFAGKYYSFTFLIHFFWILFLSLFLNRLIYLLLIQHFNASGFFQKRLIIIGYNETAANVIRLLEADFIGVKIIGICIDDENVSSLSSYPVIGKVNSVLTLAKLHHITDIYSTILPEEDPRILSLMQEADRSFIHFRMIPNLDFFIKSAYHIDFIGPIPVVAKRKEPLYESSNRIKKRIFDIIFSILIILFIMSWLTPLISILILMETGWPIFFFQPRNGESNQVFSCIKFRSMKLNQQAHSLQATANDNRITRFGKFLRKTSLDEFPQFFNVLLGSMSIVGPRPHMLQHTEIYSQKVDQFMLRHFIKPGITGWAQINGYRGETETIAAMEQRVSHDLWYLENWSLWLDLKIIFSTFLQVLKGDQKAY
ncbi:MAG: undecaprenyl-phosphate glucose phosphotransferase [Bacteroidetes bacterium]|nr:undecaprenyl-phosphate glucose phosphotransferase [Bacteroidota bacterium]